jgi:hypothetical protein
MPIYKANVRSPIVSQVNGMRIGEPPIGELRWRLRCLIVDVANVLAIQCIAGAVQMWAAVADQNALGRAFDLGQFIETGGLYPKYE